MNANVDDERDRLTDTLVDFALHVGANWQSALMLEIRLTRLSLAELRGLVDRVYFRV